MSSDEALLNAWRAGDRAAGNELFQRHFEPVRRFFINKVDHQAAELVQKTFLRCVTAQDRFEGRSSFRTFLFAIAHNVLREHYRHKRRVGASDELGDYSVVDLGAGPSTMLERRREQKALLMALRRIPLKFQVVLELYFWERMTGAQISEALGIPEDTARSRIRRGKELLRTALQRVAAAAVAESTADGLEGWAAAVRQTMR